MSFRIRPIRREKRRPLRQAAVRLRSLIARLPIGKTRRLIACAVVAGRPLWRLGGRFAERREREHRVKRALSIGVACIVALTIVFLVASLLLSAGGLTFGSFAQMTGAPIGTDGRGLTNILLLGQGDETGQDLTDTIIVASIDPAQTQSIMLLSLPRDLYFLHTDHAMETEKGKLNALWRDNRILLHRKGLSKEEAAKAALSQLAREIGNALGVEIHHAVKVDFTAAERAIDAIGGIDIVVPETIHDTEFPDGNYGYATFHIDAGMHHLDGATALKYARTRATTSDFDRSVRQQRILKAIAERAREAGMLKHPQKLIELFSILREHIETTLTTRQMITLAAIVRDIDPNTVTALQLNDMNGLYGEPQWKAGLLYAPPRDLFDGAFVLLPVSIPEFPVTWRQVQVLAQLLFGERRLFLSAPRFAVLNGGAEEGSAGRLARELTKFGFDVVNTANVPSLRRGDGGQAGERRDIGQSFITRNTDNVSESTVAFFADLLSIPIQPLPQEMRTQETGDVTIVLGTDFEFAYFQDLIPDS